MLLAHRIALAPNNKQATYFARASGVARFAYNWALAEWRCEYKEGGRPSEMMLRKRLNALEAGAIPVDAQSRELRGARGNQHRRRQLFELLPGLQEAKGATTISLPKAEKEGRS